MSGFYTEKIGKNGYWIKKMIADLGNMTEKEVVLSRVKRFTQDDQIVILLFKFQQLIVSSNYLRNEAYAFYVEKKSYKEIEEEYNINKKYLKNVIYRESLKIRKDLLINPYEEFKLDRLNNNEELVQTVSIILDNLLSKLSFKEPDIKLGHANSDSKNNKLSKMSVDLSEYSEVDRSYNVSVTDENFIQLVHALKQFSKPYQENLIKRVDEKAVGYIYYLLTREDKSLTEIDKERKQLLNDIWLLNKEGE